MAGSLGAAYTLGGRVTDAVALLTQAMEQTIPMEMVGDQAFCRLSLGEAQALAGLLEEAHALAVQTLVLARAHQERGYQAYALRLLGEIASRRDPPDREHRFVRARGRSARRSTASQRSRRVGASGCRSTSTSPSSA